MYTTGVIHRIDRFILTQLLTHEFCSFSSLRAPGVEGNTLTYRLKRLMKLGYVDKGKNGRYFLTAEGRYFTDRLSLGKFVSRELPKPLTLIVCRRGDEWLLHKRAIHPLRNLVGLPHASVYPGLSVIETAEKRLEEVFNLKTKLRYRGSAYLTFYKNGQLESYTQMNIVENCEPVKGELKVQQKEKFGTYFWTKNPNFTESQYISSVRFIKEALDESKEIFFLEKVFDID